jgi:hypothetical protein
MVLSDGDQAIVREYLLGRLSDEERESFEQRLMSEDDLFEELEISTGEVIEEYRAGELTQTERQWFEGHFLTSTEGRQRFMLAIALSRLQPSQQEAERPTFFESLTSLFKQHRWKVATATSGLLVLIVAFLLIPRPPGQTVTGPTLTPSLTNRGAGSQPTKIALPYDAAQLKLRLLLPEPSTPDARYKAELDNRTEVNPVTVVESDDGSVTVSIPVELLPPGEYSLILFRITNDGTSILIPRYYHFNIQQS